MGEEKKMSDENRGGPRDRSCRYPSILTHGDLDRILKNFIFTQNLGPIIRGGFDVIQF